VTGDDERRAEIEDAGIEAAVRAVAADAGIMDLENFEGPIWHSTRIAITAYLDRVRDARGDDEAVSEIVRRLRYSDGIVPDAAVREIADWIESQYPAARSSQGRRPRLAARSPQGARATGGRDG
jgi:hypothetical protein